MSRLIIFRGLTVDTKEWIYGSLIRKENIDLIGGYVNTPPTMSDPGGDTIWYEEPVIRESIGQFSGLRDKYGEMKFEGDITLYTQQNRSFEIKFDGAAFWEVCIDDLTFGKSLTTSDLGEIIGNIHQNKDLLKLK
jgi:hypothetical protein